MRKLSHILIAATWVATVLAGQAQAQSAPASGVAKPNILVMGEDADTDSVPRGNRVFQRVIQALGEDMNVAGYNVYDETAAAMAVTEPNRVRRRDAELIDVARAIQAPPIDVVAVFTIFASAQDSAYSDVKRPQIRIPGRLLNVRTGQQIGAFEVSGLQLPPLPVACDRECVLEKVGDSASTLASELSVALADKLDGFIGQPGTDPLLSPGANSGTSGVTDGGAVVSKDPPAAPSAECDGLPTAYVMRFEGFDETEITALEEYISAFSCLMHQRPVRSSPRLAEYWYETRSQTARLNRNLRLMLEHMGTNGQVRFAGNTFVITKVATR